MVEVRERHLPWLIRILFRLVTSGLDKEQEALAEIGAPKIDAFIRWDPALAATYKSKYVRAVADYLAAGYGADDTRIHEVEYEIAYLRRKEPIRARLAERDLEDLFVDIGKEEAGGGE